MFTEFQDKVMLYLEKHGENRARALLDGALGQYHASADHYKQLRMLVFCGMVEKREKYYLLTELGKRYIAILRELIENPTGGSKSQ